MAEATISSRRRRIFAFLIDHIIMSFLAAVGSLLALGKHWDMASPVRGIGTILVTLLVVFVVYFMKDSIRGMSPGRLVLGIAVRDHADPGITPSIGRLMLRNLLIVIWPVEFFVLALSKEKRRLGDRAAKTIVVRRDDIPLGKRLLFFVGLALVFGLLFAGSIGAIVKNSAAYEHAIAHLEASPEVNARVGQIAGYGFFPTGSIQVQNEYGQAEIEITVNGDKGSATVLVIMEKEPGTDWQLRELKIVD
jgi:uncharacterized RDD family membrane protein YckC